MNTIEENIIRISKKFQQLLKQYQLLQKENNQLNAIIQQLKDEKETSVKKINSLQEQVLILKSATAEMNEADKKEFEKTINQYLKDIDKCINFLSE